MITTHRNVQKVTFGERSRYKLPLLTQTRGWTLVLVDDYFRTNPVLLGGIICGNNMLLHYIDTSVEPSVDRIDELIELYLDRPEGHDRILPGCIVGIGGGSTLDTAKAVSILLTNPGKAEDYQGWDLVKNPSIYKIGIPTLSGTGSESSRTCVLTNKEKNLKLGINSDYSMFDEIILDPDLTRTVPRDQFVYTMMDTYYHCTEYMSGMERNMITDSLAYEASLLLFDVIWGKKDILEFRVREKVMVASYLGGTAAGCTGIVHPFSAGLSMVLGIRHGLANCIAACSNDDLFRVYRRATQFFMGKLDVELPVGVCNGLTDEQHNQLYEATVVHEKPLANALGPDWKDILTGERVRSIFEGM